MRCGAACDSRFLHCAVAFAPAPVGMTKSLGAPDVLLGVEGGEHYGFMVHAGGVVVDGGGGLGAEVAVARIEVERADVVGAMSAGELHAALDASDGVEAFHRFECNCLAEK